MANPFDAFDQPATQGNPFDKFETPAAPNAFDRIDPPSPSLSTLGTAPRVDVPQMPPPAEDADVATYLKADLEAEARKRRAADLEDERSRITIERQRIKGEDVLPLAEASRTQGASHIFRSLAGLFDASGMAWDKITSLPGLKIGHMLVSQALRDKAAERQEESDTLMEESGKDFGGKGGAVRDIAGTTVASLPAMGAAPAGIPAMAAAAGIQQFGSVFEDATSAYMSQGMDQEQAQQKALLPAAIGGVITAGLTRVMSGGAEGLAADVLAGKLSRQSAAQIIARVITSGVEEFPEEFADELGQGIVAKLTYDEGRDIGDIWGNAVYAGTAGVISAAGIGGAGGAISAAGQTVTGIRRGNRLSRLQAERQDPARAAQLQQRRQEIRTGELTDEIMAAGQSRRGTPPPAEDAGAVPPSPPPPAPPSPPPLPAAKPPEVVPAAPQSGAKAAVPTPGTTIDQTPVTPEQAITWNRINPPEIKKQQETQTAKTPDELVLSLDEPTDKTTSMPSPELYPVRRVDPKTLKLSAEVPNFKANANPKTGEVTPIEAEKYDYRDTGAIQVWVRLNGDREVISGRHRWQQALRTNSPIPIQEHFEKDGFTAIHARILDAELNIRDGQGEVEDYANYFRNTDYNEQQARSHGLLRTAKGFAGWHLGRNASDNLYALYRADKIGEREAVAIAAAAPGNANLQQVGINAAASGAKSAEIVGRMEAARASAASSGAKADQFDFFSDTKQEAVWKLQGDFVAKKRKELQDIITTRKTVVNRYEAAVATGSIKAKKPQAVAELEAALAELERWKNWAQDPDLRKMVEAAGRGETPVAPPVAPAKAAKPKKVAPPAKPEEPAVVPFPQYPVLPTKAEGGTFKMIVEANAKHRLELEAWTKAQPENKAIIIGNEDPKSSVKAITKEITGGWRTTTFVWSRDESGLMPWGHTVYKTREEAVQEAVGKGSKPIDKLPARVLTEKEIKGYLHMEDVKPEELHWYKLGKKQPSQFLQMAGAFEGLVIDSEKDGKIAWNRELNPELAKYLDLTPVQKEQPVDLKADIARYAELDALFTEARKGKDTKALMEFMASPEYMAIAQEQQAIKNRHGGHKPMDVPVNAIEELLRLSPEEAQQRGGARFAEEQAQIIKDFPPAAQKQAMAVLEQLLDGQRKVEAAVRARATNEALPEAEQLKAAQELSVESTRLNYLTSAMAVLGGKPTTEELTKPKREPKFKEGDKVMVGTPPMNREGVIAAYGPYRDGVQHYFVKTNLGEVAYAESDIQPLESQKPKVTFKVGDIVELSGGDKFHSNIRGKVWDVKNEGALLEIVKDGTDFPVRITVEDYPNVKIIIPPTPDLITGDGGAFIKNNIFDKAEINALLKKWSGREAELLSSRTALREFLTDVGQNVRESVYESAVGETPPKNSGELLTFLEEHYDDIDWPNQLASDFPFLKGNPSRKSNSENSSGVSTLPDLITGDAKKTPEQLAEEKRLADQKAEIAKLQGKKLSGSVDTTMVLPGTEEAAGLGDIPLLTQPAKKPASTPPPSAPPAGYGDSNKLVSKDDYEKIKEQLRKKLGGTYMGVDPEFLTLGAQAAMYHIEAGARVFADFAGRMIADFGDGIKPYLRSLYDAARGLPGNTFEDEMTDPVEVRRQHKEILTNVQSTPSGAPGSTGAAPSTKPAAKPDVAPGSGDRGTGSQPSDSGATGGTGVAGSQRPGIRVARQELIPRPRPVISPDTYATVSGFRLDDQQVLAVNLALNRFEDGGTGFMLADGTGFGKTAQILAIADQFKKATGKPVLIITQNRQIIAGTFTSDSKAMGINLKNFELGTYDDVRTGKAGNDDYGLVVYDEAHNLKNDAAKKSEAAARISAEHILFATATPLDRPSGAAYFLSAVLDIDEQTMRERLGFKVVDKKLPNGDVKQMAVLDEGMTWARVIQNIVNIRDTAIKSGAFIRREYPFWGTIKNERYSLPLQSVQDQNEIDEYWQDRIASASSPQMKRNMAGQRTMELSRWTEQIKADDVMKAAQAALAEGKSVVIIAEGINDTNVKGLGDDGTMVKGLISILVKRFEEAGIPVSKVFGDNDKASEVDDFQSGKTRVLIATPKSGGTGINLDDRMGSKPRKMIIATANFSGDVFDQILGRISRKTTMSPSEIEFHLFSDAISDGRRQEILDRKVQALRAIQGGEDLDVAGFQPDEDPARPAEPPPRVEVTKGPVRWKARVINAKGIVVAENLWAESEQEAHAWGDAAAQRYVDKQSGKAPTGFKPAGAPGPMVKPPPLPWDKFITRAGKTRYRAQVTPEFMSWFNAYPQSARGLGISVSNFGGRTWAWANQPGGQAKQGSLSGTYQFGDVVITAPGVSKQGALTAYHGTPHEVDQFSLDRIGTGEGAQVYGWGLYFAQNIKVAKQYKKDIGRKALVNLVRNYFSELESPEFGIEDLMADLTANNKFTTKEKRLLLALAAEDWWGFDYPHQAVKAALTEDPSNWDAGEETRAAITELGNTYQVRIDANEDELLDWDKPLSEQSEKVKAGVRKAFIERGMPLDSNREPLALERNPDGQSIQAWLSGAKPERMASELLLKHGIKGIRYADQGSRNGFKAYQQPNGKWGVSIVSNMTFRGDTPTFATQQEAEAWIDANQTFNYVVFDDSIIKIIGKNGEMSLQSALATRPPSELLNPDATATGIENIRTMLDNPAAKLPERVKQVIRAMIDMPVMRDLDWSNLEVAIRDRLDDGFAGSADVVNNLIEIARSADPDVFPHEVFHFLYEMLPASDKLIVDTLRKEAIQTALERKDLTDDARKWLSALNTGAPLNSLEFSRQELPYEFYKLINASEFLAGMLGPKFADNVWTTRNQNAVQRFIAKVKGFVQGLVDALRRVRGKDPTLDQLYRELLAGKHTNRMNATIDEVFSVQGAFSKTAGEARNAARLAQTTEDIETEATHQLAQSADIVEFLEKHDIGNQGYRAQRLLDYPNYTGIREIGRRLNSGVIETYRQLKARTADPYKQTWLARLANSQLEGFIRKVKNVTEQRDKQFKAMARPGFMALMAAEQMAKQEADAAAVLLRNTTAVFNSAIKKATKAMEQERQSDLEVARIEGALRQIDDAAKSSTAMQQLMTDMVNILSSTPDGLRMLTDSSYGTRTALLDLYRDMKRSVGQPLHNETLLRWAAYILERNKEVRDSLLAQQMASRSPMRPLLSAYETAFLDGLQSDPIKTIKEAIRERVDLTGERDRTAFVFRELHKELMDKLTEYQAMDEAASVGEQVTADPDFVGLRKEVAADAKMLGNIEPARPFTEKTILLPSGREFDMTPADLVGSKTLFAAIRLRYEAAKADYEAWLGNPANIDDPNYGMHQRNYAIITTYFTGLSMIQPNDSHRFFKRSLDIVKNAVAVGGGRLQSGARKAAAQLDFDHHAASLWTQKYSHALAAAVQAAIKSHDIDYSTFGGVSVHDANTIYYEMAGNQLRYSYNRQAGGLKAGDRLGSGWTVTKEDMALVKLEADAVSEAFKIVGDRQLTKDTLGGYTLYRRALKGNEMMTPRIYTDDKGMLEFARQFDDARKANDEARMLMLLDRYWTRIGYALVWDRNPDFARETVFDGPGGAFEAVANQMAARPGSIPSSDALFNELSALSTATPDEAKSIFLAEVGRYIHAWRQEMETDLVATNIPKGEDTKNAFTRSRNEAIAPYIFYENGFKNTNSIDRFGIGILSRSFDDMTAALRAQLQDVERQEREFQAKVMELVSQGKTPKQAQNMAQHAMALERANGRNYDQYQNFEWRIKVLKDVIKLIEDTTGLSDDATFARYVGDLSGLLIGTAATARNVTLGPMFIGHLAMRLGIVAPKAYALAAWKGYISPGLRMIPSLLWSGIKSATWHPVHGAWNALTDAEKREAHGWIGTLLEGVVTELGETVYTRVNEIKRMKDAGVLFIHPVTQQWDNVMMGTWLSRGRILDKDMTLTEKVANLPAAMLEVGVLTLQKALMPQFGDTWLNYGVNMMMRSSVGPFHLWETSLRRMYAEYKKSGYRVFDFANKQNPVNRISHQEFFPRGLFRMRAASNDTDMMRVRQHFLDSGFDFDEKAMEFLAELDKGNTSAQFLSEQERDKMVSAAIDWANRASLTNNPLRLKQTDWLTTLIKPFMQWKVRMLSNAINEVSVAAQTKKPVNSRMALFKSRAFQYAVVATSMMMPLLFWNAVVGAADEEENRLLKQALFNQVTGFRQPWERDQPMAGWGIYAMASVPFMDMLVSTMLSDMPNRASFDPSLAMIEKGKDISRYIGGVMQTGDWTFRLPETIGSIFPDAKMILNRMPGQAEKRELSNVVALARRHGETELLRPADAGRSGGIQATPLSPYADRMVSAALQGNTAELQRVYAEAVEVARDLGKEDPEQAVRQMFEGRNPYNRVFRSRPTDAQRASMLASMTPAERAAVESVEERFASGARAIGGSTRFVSGNTSGTSTSRSQGDARPTSGVTRISVGPSSGGSRGAVGRMPSLRSSVPRLRRAGRVGVRRLRRAGARTRVARFRKVRVRRG
jgi:hypothetical protein